MEAESFTARRPRRPEFDVGIIGGCGHVGLTLAIAFARKGMRVAALDVDSAALALVRAGKMPFLEEGGEEKLREALDSGRLQAAEDPGILSGCASVVCSLGEPAAGGPEIPAGLGTCLSYLRDGQLLVLRGTVHPGTTERVDGLLRSRGLVVDVAYCPERTAQGVALRELHELPQIISACSPRGQERVRELFRVLTEEIVELSPLEAEVAKLFTNAWRYITFAAANQLFTLADAHGLDFYRIHDAVTRAYARAAGLPRAGFAGGPCLPKDTRRLAAFDGNDGFIGLAALRINEGLPAYLLESLRKRFPLRSMVAGILGIAFKADCDDTRGSLALRLRDLLEPECREVLLTDPYVRDARLLPVSDVIGRSDLLILGAPHGVYSGLDLRGRPVLDVWNFFGHGSLFRSPCT
jgi:UDP-N-acetyl-D-mannosaminuronic acid dehydrogenase